MYMYITQHYANSSWLLLVWGKNAHLISCMMWHQLFVMDILIKIVKYSQKQEQIILKHISIKITCIFLYIKLLFSMMAWIEILKISLVNVACILWSWWSECFFKTCSRCRFKSKYSLNMVFQYILCIIYLTHISSDLPVCLECNFKFLQTILGPWYKGTIGVSIWRHRSWLT